jgi:hypothetical protein
VTDSIVTPDCGAGAVCAQRKDELADAITHANIQSRRQNTDIDALFPEKDLLLQQHHT